MDKKEFDVEVVRHLSNYFVGIKYRDQEFFIVFESEDQWNSFTLADEDVYDVHLLVEEGVCSVSIYAVRKVYERDVNNGLLLEMLEIDTSNEGQQLVNLTVKEA